MVRWCAYCQKFQGEIAPFDSSAFTHGICRTCAKRGLDLSPSETSRIENLVQVQRELRELGKTDGPESDSAAFELGRKHGIRPADLLLGFIGPMLYAEGMERLALRLIESRRLHEMQNVADSVDVLLTTTPGNGHTFSVQFLELWLRSEGISTRAIWDQTKQEIVEVCRTIRPKIVGFSISSRDQLLGLRQTIESLRNQSKLAPLFLVGGYAAKTNLISNSDVPGASLVTDESKLFLLVKTHLSLAFLYDLPKKQSV